MDDAPPSNDSNVRPLPGRECRCKGDGRTWADTSDCPVHDHESSPLAQGVRATYDAGCLAAREWYVERLESALRTIRGPADNDPWMEAYRQAGGGYEGLQAIAEAALAAVATSEEPGDDS